MKKAILSMWVAAAFLVGGTQTVFANEAAPSSPLNLQSVKKLS